MAYNVDNAKKVLNALAMAGANPTVIPFLMSQVAHETGNFDSNLFRTHNNASGITFTTSGRQKNATRGNPLPLNEQPIVNGKRVTRYYYARFNSLKDWAIDYLRIVGNTVLNSKDIVEYARKLRERKYYTATLQSYTKALQSHLTRLEKLGLTKFVNSFDQSTMDEKKKPNNGFIRDFINLFSVFK